MGWCTYGVVFSYALMAAFNTCHLPNEMSLFSRVFSILGGVDVGMGGERRHIEKIGQLFKSSTGVLSPCSPKVLAEEV